MSPFPLRYNTPFLIDCIKWILLLVLNIPLSSQSSDHHSNIALFILLSPTIKYFESLSSNDFIPDSSTLTEGYHQDFEASPHCTSWEGLILQCHEGGVDQSTAPNQGTQDSNTHNHPSQTPSQPTQTPTGSTFGHSLIISGDDPQQPFSSSQPDSQNSLPRPLTSWPFMTSSEGGSDDPDPDPDNTGLDQEFDSYKKFNDLKKRAKKIKWNDIKKRYKLIIEISRFSKEYKEFAPQCYNLIQSLLKTFSFFTDLLIRAATLYTFSFSGFENQYIALLRGTLVTTSGTLAISIPWLVADNVLVASLSTAGGILLFAFADNGLAKSAGSPYAMEWNSQEFRSFLMTAISLTAIKIVSLKSYSFLLADLVSKPMYKSLPALLIFDYFAKPVVYYLLTASETSGYPAICLTCGPNPYSSYEFPISNFCPKPIEWIPWRIGCSQNTTIQELDSMAFDSP